MDIDSREALRRAATDEESLTALGRTSWGVCAVATLVGVGAPFPAGVVAVPVALVAALAAVAANNRREKLRSDAARRRDRRAASGGPVG